MTATKNVSPVKMEEYRRIVKLAKPYNGIEIRKDIVAILKSQGVAISDNILRDAHKFTGVKLIPVKRKKKPVAIDKADYMPSFFSKLVMSARWDRSFSM